MPNVANTQITEARETYLTLLDLSRLLNTGLDPETLTVCVRLLETGVNPETLATVIRELRKEAAGLSDAPKCNEETPHNLN